MKKLFFISVLIVGFFYITGCNFNNVDDIKSHANKTLQNCGYTITGYEGYMLGGWSAPGGEVWYQFIRPGQSNVVYDGCVIEWWGDYEIANVKALNAISPR